MPAQESKKSFANLAYEWLADGEWHEFMEGLPLLRPAIRPESVLRWGGRGRDIRKDGLGNAVYRWTMIYARARLSNLKALEREGGSRGRWRLVPGARLPGEIACEHCGTVVTAKSPCKRFCSSRCTTAAYLARKKQESSGTESP